MLINNRRANILTELDKSLHSFEKYFNGRAKYPYIFFNHEPTSEEIVRFIKKKLSKNAKVSFEVIPKHHFSVPSFIDMNSIYRYDKPVGYLLMCAWFSHYFYLHEALKDYDFYWRLDSDSEYLCNIDIDPFVVMEENDFYYGQLISTFDPEHVVFGLWNHTLNFINQYDKTILKKKEFEYLKKRNGLYRNTYYYNNFEIGRLSFLKGEEYNAYVEYLKKQGGTFYHRWGDGPIRTIALMMFLKEEQIFDFSPYISYQHIALTTCAEYCKSNVKCVNRPQSLYSDRIIKTSQKKIYILNEN